MSEAKDPNLNRHLDREGTNGKAKQMFNVLRAVRSGRFDVDAPGVRRFPRELPRTEIYDPGIGQNRSRKATQPKRPSMLNALSELGGPFAARTNRIRIASGVLLMPFHSPVRLAEDIAVVDVISGGRFELGVGVGFKHEEFEGFGLSLKERRARTNQSVE
jgi:hypothetical protein